MQRGILGTTRPTIVIIIVWHKIVIVVVDVLRFVDLLLEETLVLGIRGAGWCCSIGRCQRVV